MFRILSKLKINRKGQSIVEFALILPLLLILIMGIIQFGLILSGYVSITNAAREGARIGIVQKDFSVAQTKAKAKVIEALDISPTLSIDGEPGIISNFKPGDPFEVTVNAKVKIIVPFVLNDSELSISRKAVMKVEGYGE